MPDPIIQFEKVGKCYRLGEVGAASFKDEISRIAARILRRPDPTRTLFSGRQPSSGSNAGGRMLWALRGVDCEIYPGEVVGIIGRNGAGKSTLLKLLSRITAPTEGEIRMRGKVSSLLEVGTGFHPELTGRENIYLNGAIMGMTKAEIRRKFDQIVEFSELSSFLDTPVKRYSSGMYVRLGFAIAAHLDPEILIVDEVLAVGDIQFQRKCIEKMDTVSQAGRTVLFVSHNMDTIRSLCRRCAVLDGGRMAYFGQTSDAVLYYQGQFIRGTPDYRNESGSNRPHVVRIELFQDGKLVKGAVAGNSPLDVRVELESFGSRRLILELFILNHRGVSVIHTSDELLHLRRNSVHPRIRQCRIPGGTLRDGSYTLSYRLGQRFIETADHRDAALSFEVLFDGMLSKTTKSGDWQGVLPPEIAGWDSPDSGNE